MLKPDDKERLTKWIDGMQSLGLTVVTDDKGAWYLLGNEEIVITKIQYFPNAEFENRFRFVIENNI